MPLKSWRVVVSGLMDGGFWFQPGWSSVSSVREGQFMMGVGGIFFSQKRVSGWYGIIKVPGYQAMIVSSEHKDPVGD
jgi:hypothetical protein